MGTVERNYDDLVADDQECPFQFTLGGEEWHCRPVDDIPWAMVEDFFIAQQAGNINGVVVNVDSFMAGVLAPDEIEDFLELKNDPATGISYKKMSALLMDLVSEVFGTPTKRPRRSQAGSQKTGRTSGGGSSPKGSQKRRAG